MIAALDSRPAKKNNCRPQEQIVNREANPGNRPPLYPARVVIHHPRRSFAGEHFFEITDGLHRGESGFTDVDLISVLDRAQEFDPIERAEIQVPLEVERSLEFLRGALGNSRDQLTQRMTGFRVSWPVRAGHLLDCP